MMNVVPLQEAALPPIAVPIMINFDAPPCSAACVFTDLPIERLYALIDTVVEEYMATQKGIGIRIKTVTPFFNTAAVFGRPEVPTAISLLLGELKLMGRRVMRRQTKRGTLPSGAKAAT